MRKFLICLAVIAVLTLLGGRAIAVPVYFGDGGVSLQGALDGITIGPTPGVSSVDVVNDAIADGGDATWAIHGSGGSVGTLIIEIAGWAGLNTFGIYDAGNPLNMVEVFDGAAGTGSQALLSILNNGSVIVNFTDTGVDFSSNNFGYYLDSTVGHPGWTGGVWHSGTSLNVDGMDHMYAYHGTGDDTIQIQPFSPGIWDSDEYVLAFEDLHAMHWGDQDGFNEPGEWSDIEPDFSDFVVIVESVDPVPEPSFILLLGSLLIGLGLLERRRYMK